MTSIVVIVVVIVASITMECMLGLILTGYIVVNAMMNTFEALLMIRCKEKCRQNDNVKNAQTRGIYYLMQQSL